MSLAAPPPARFFAVIPCAGSGTRAGTAQPKQYEELLGQPMVAHTLAAFAAVSPLSGGVVVVSPDDNFMSELLEAHPSWPFQVRRVGGASRAASVLAGLGELSALGALDSDWVLVHDAARCLVTPEQIHRLMGACMDDSVGGLLAFPLTDTLKQETDGRAELTMSRDGKWQAQTPQMFRLGELSRALVQSGADVTDESSAMEALGHAPLLVRGSAQNFKVTYPEDFEMAKAILSWRLKD